MELNPYLKDNESGYPEEMERIKTESKQLLSSSIVGDGGASWRLKALKRAQEQAAREGKKLQEVVEDRWGSMGQLAASVASRNVAPTFAHLHAIKKRKGLVKEERGKIAEETGRSTQKKEVEKMKVKHDTENSSYKMPIDGTTSRCILHDVSSRQNKKEEDADLNLAKKIMHKHRFSISGQADDEYDYDDGPRTKTRTKGRGDNRKSSEITNSAKRFMTQQDRCQFCFDNPTRPKHLAIAIANFTYLSLPQMQPIVAGHCYIVTLQHESSTRTVDDDVWDEIRNFKKCLIMMFSKQERDVVFLETVLGLANQRRHCLVECVPLPREIVKQAPVYFKKAIDEAEDEWSQHNAKKLINTSVKGLRNSIPKNFPYFHVEFGLDKGFVHVIDDEKGFKSSFGLDIIRGMLQLPAEDMHRRWRHESLDRQKQAVASFASDWEPFDWTKQLD